MVNSVQFEILRDERAKVITDNKKKDRLIEELVGNDNKNHKIIEELVSTLSAVKSELIDAKRRIAYYENPHTPPSQNNIPSNTPSF